MSATEEEELPAAFVQRLNQALMVSRLHDLSNVALAVPLSELRGAIERAIDAHGSASVKVDPVSSVVFFNEQALHSKRRLAATLEALLACFETFGISELRFSRVLTDAEVRLLIEIFKERGHGRDTVLSFKRIAEGLLAGGLRGAVDIVSAEQAGKAVQKKAHVDERVVVRLAYARTLALMGEYKEHGREPDLRRYFWRKMTRAVQGLATLASKEFGQRALLSLTTIKDADERWVTHAVNTCILSILLGRKLGLPRAQLAHVGLAALLHRVGEVRGAPAGTSKPGAHAWSGLGAILESRRTDDAALACALVVFEQGQPPSRARAPENEPHPLGQLVAICATFEELTTAVPGRLSLVPADALRMLMEGKPRPLDPTLVRIFGEVIQPPKTGAPRTDTSSSDRLGSSSSDSIRAFLEDDE